MTPHELPAALGAERAVLSGLLFDQSRFEEVQRVLGAADFYSPVHRIVFEAMQLVVAEGRALDLVTLKQQLVVRGELGAIGGDIELAQLADDAATAENIATHAQLVREAADRRSVVGALEDAAAATRDGRLPLAEALGVAKQRLSIAHRSRLELIPVGALLAEPEESVRWLVDGLLIEGGLSVLAGKPKEGKSTLARALAVAVAHGAPFLGRGVTAGRVIYCAFEDKRAELRRAFAALGARSDTALEVVVGRAPESVVEDVDRIARERQPALIVIDTLARFGRIRDFNDYAEVMRALEPVLAIARETGAHVLLVHHAKKGSGSDLDAILGSSAIAATVDTALMLRRGDGIRLLSSIQRYGSDMPETVIDRDPDTEQLRPGGTRVEREEEEIEARVLSYLASCAAPVLESEIDADVEGTKGVKVRALRALHARGELHREGRGVKGDPFRYQLPDSGLLVRDPKARTSKRETTTDEVPAAGAFEEGVA